jgi:ribosomal protein S18
MEEMSMLNIVLSLMIGSVLTYLVTILSSSIRSSEILENAMLTYALLLMSAYEVSVQQLEQTIVANKIEGRDATNLRKLHNNEFESFANNKIKEVVKHIPTAHINIIKYKNFEQLKVYVTQQFRRKHAQSKQKTKKV